MAVYKNKAGQRVAVFAVGADGAPKTGDAANITAKLSLDGGALADLDDATPDELGGGVYAFALTQAETNADLLVVLPQSSTEGVVLRPVIVYTEPEERDADVVAVKGVGVASVADFRADVSGIPAAVWGAGNRTLTDKTGYALTAAYDAAKTAAQPGDAMALTAVERLNLAAALEAAIIDDLDGTAVMEAIANLISSEIDAAGLSVETFAVAVRDAVLDRVVAGNHDLEGSVGQLLQRLDALVSSRASSEAVGNLGTLVENRTLPSEDYATPENLEPLWNAYAVSEEEFTGRTLPSEEYATGDGVAGLQALLEAIQGASFNAALHSLVKIVEGLDQKLNAVDYTAPPSEESIRAELDANSTKLANLDAPVSSRATPDDVQVEVVGEGGLTLDALQSELGALKGAGFDPGTDTLEKIREGVDAKLSADAYTAPDSAQTVAAAVIDTPEFRKILAFAAHRMRWDDGDPHVLVFYEADGETEAFRVRVAPGGEREVVE